MISAYEHFYAEYAVAAQGVGNLLGDILRLLQGALAHRLRLPGLAVVAVHLMVADRVLERRAAGVANGQQRNLIFEFHEALDDYLAADGAKPVAGMTLAVRF